MTPRVTEARYTPADEVLRASGLRGWCSFVLDGRLKVAGVGVRHTANGHVTLAYPFRDDAYGRRWRYLQPLDNATRIAIERQVLGQLGLEGSME